MNRKSSNIPSGFLVTAASILALFACVLLASASSVAQRTQNSEPLTLTSTSSLPDVHGRIDHFSVDVKGERLFMAAVGNGTLEVIDLKSGRRVHSIRNLDEPQGVFYDPATNHLYVACGGDGVTRIFDATTFQPARSVRFPEDADNIRYDERSKMVIVGYGGTKQLRQRESGSGALGFINSAGQHDAARDIIVDAHPESFQLEKSGTRVFVNVPDKKEIEVGDLATRKIVARWPVSCNSNFPMALDESHHRLLVACREPARLVVFDTSTGKQTASADIAGHSDDLFYDTRRARVYALTSAGFLDVLQQADPDHYTRIAHLPTPPGAQTGLFVPDLDKLFVGIPAREKQGTEVRVYQAR